MKILLTLLFAFSLCFGVKPMLCNTTAVDTLGNWDAELVESWQELYVYLESDEAGVTVLTLWGPRSQPVSYTDAGGSLSSGGEHLFVSGNSKLKVEGTLEGLRVTPYIGDDLYVSISFRCSEGL